MTRKTAVSATAVAHKPVGRRRSDSPQHDPLRLLCVDSATVQAARRLAESISGNPDRIAAIILILRGRAEAQK